VAGSCEYGNEHSDSINVRNFLTICVIVSFSRSVLLHGISYLVSEVAFS
jgi:hypothetical protein